ncbi:MAG: PadR family transcriptional regulator, partial [Sinomonas sp.]|nr:PadR family transcriptional regulator [Sinomonas sp.]
MPKRPVSNPLALAVLACVWERPMYPYEITTTLRERGKQDSIRLNFGSLYAVIRSLESNGLIRAARTEREGNRPERIVYEITPAGMTEALDWMRDLLARPVKEYPDFEAGLSLLPILAPGEARRCLEERLERLD